MLIFYFLRANVKNLRILQLIFSAPKSSIEIDMKKRSPIVVSIFALFLTFTLAACGGGNESSTSIADSSTVAPPKLYSVTFNSNGATNAPAPAGNATNKTGDVIKVAEPENLAISGYHFTGWNTKSNGSGNIYLPGSSLQFANENIVLYAQWEANKMKITQVGGENSSRIIVEWYDGSKQDFVYSGDFVGLGGSYNLYTIVGGLAILLDGGSRYIHTCYPTDYLPGYQPVMNVMADGKPVLAAKSKLLADRSGDLSSANSVISASEIKVVVTGRLVDVEGDTEVEITLRADAPRMLLSQAKITYSKQTSIERMYHQMMHANPAYLKGNQRYLFAKDGVLIEDTKVPENLTTGIFFKSDNYYVGFVAPMEGSKDLYSWVSGDYHAAYKIAYDKVVKKQGESTVSHGLSTWGYASTEAAQLMNWANQIRQGGTPTVDSTSYADVAKVNMINKSFHY